MEERIGGKRKEKAKNEDGKKGRKTRTKWEGNREEEQKEKQEENQKMNQRIERSSLLHS